MAGAHMGSLGSLSPVLSSPSGLPGRPGPRALPPDAGSSRATSSRSGWDPEPEAAHASRPGHGRRGRATLRPPPPPPPPDSFPSGSRLPRSSLWASPRSPRGSAPFPRPTGFEAQAGRRRRRRGPLASPRPAPPRPASLLRPGCGSPDTPRGLIPTRGLPRLPLGVAFRAGASVLGAGVPPSVLPPWPPAPRGWPGRVAADEGNSCPSDQGPKVSGTHRPGSVTGRPPPLATRCRGSPGLRHGLTS